jgi:hypothetical protein
VRHDQIVEASIPRPLAKPIASLRRHGYRLVTQGVGEFGAVLAKPGRDDVVKLFLSKDRAYRAFIELAQAHPNAHFPRFPGNILRATSDYNVVRVERLTPNRSVAMTKFCHLTALYMETINEQPEAGLAGASVRQAREYVGSSDMKAACDLLAGLLTTYNLDLDTRNNVMMRGNTFVFSDPVAVAL